MINLLHFSSHKGELAKTTDLPRFWKAASLVHSFFLIALGYCLPCLWRKLCNNVVVHKVWLPQEFPNVDDSDPDSHSDAALEFSDEPEEEILIDRRWQLMR